MVVSAPNWFTCKNHVFLYLPLGLYSKTYHCLYRSHLCATFAVKQLQSMVLSVLLVLLQGRLPCTDGWNCGWVSVSSEILDLNSVLLTVCRRNI